MRLLLLVALAAAARRLGELVNLERYPIGDLASAEGRALVEKARSDLAATGCASFPCFLMEAALSDAVAEATAAAPSAFATDDTHNAYQLSDTDATLPATLLPPAPPPGTRIDDSGRAPATAAIRRSHTQRARPVY